MASAKDIQAQLDAMKDKQTELRKQLTKQKRKEERELIYTIGKYAKERFSTLKTEQQFKDFFYSISIPEEPKDDVAKEQSEIQKTASAEVGNQSVYDEIQNMDSFRQV